MSVRFGMEDPFLAQARAFGPPFAGEGSRKKCYLRLGGPYRRGIRMTEPEK